MLHESCNMNIVSSTTRIHMVKDIVLNAVRILRIGVKIRNKWYGLALAQNSIVKIGEIIIIAVPKSGWLNTIKAGIMIIKIGIKNDEIFFKDLFLSDK